MGQRGNHGKFQIIFQTELKCKYNVPPMWDIPRGVFVGQGRPLSAYI